MHLKVVHIIAPIFNMKFDSSSSFNCPGKEHIKFRIGEDLQIIFCLHKNSNMISGSGYKMEEDMSVNKGV